MKRLLAVMACGLLWCATAVAEDVVLSDGRVISGTIKGQKDGILEIVTADGNSIFVNVSKVESIRRGDDGAEQPVKNPENPDSGKTPVEEDAVAKRIRELEAEIERLRTLKSANPEEAGTLEQEIAQLKQDVASLKSDLAATDDIYDRMAQFARELDDIRNEQKGEYDKLRKDLNNNSAELLKLIVEMGDLKKQIAAAPGAPDPEAVKSLAAMEEQIADLRDAVGQDQSVLSDIRDLKLKNAEMEREIQALKERQIGVDEETRKKIEREIVDLSTQRMAELEKQNQLLISRIDELKNHEVEQLRGEVDELRRKLNELSGGVASAPVPAAAAGARGVAPEAVAAPMSPWCMDVWASSGAKTEGLGSAVEAVQALRVRPDNAERWLELAESALSLGDSLFYSATSKQQRGQSEAALQKYRDAVTWYALSMDRFCEINRVVHTAKCTEKQLALEKRMALCKARINYLSIR